MEVLTFGVRLIRPGNNGAPALEPPPHAAKANKEKIEMIDRRRKKRNFPMPYSHLASAWRETHAQGSIQLGRKLVV
jgi:hypothetical protein